MDQNGNDGLPLHAVPNRRQRTNLRNNIQPAERQRHNLRQTSDKKLTKPTMVRERQPMDQTHRRLTFLAFPHLLSLPLSLSFSFYIMLSALPPQKGSQLLSVRLSLNLLFFLSHVFSRILFALG